MAAKQIIMRILKYGLHYIDDQIIEMPLKSEILDIQDQAGKLVLWALCDEKSELVEVQIRAFFTGEELPADFDHTYLKTMQIGMLVFHFFMSNK